MGLIFFLPIIRKLYGCVRCERILFFYTLFAEGSDANAIRTVQPEPGIKPCRRLRDTRCCVRHQDRLGFRIYRTRAPRLRYEGYAIEQSYVGIIPARYRLRPQFCVERLPGMLHGARLGKRASDRHIRSRHRFSCCVGHRRMLV